MENKNFKFLITLLLIISGVVSLLTPVPVHAQTCTKHNTGDTNCDNSIDLIDFETFRTEFLAFRSGQLNIQQAKANFNDDTSIDLLDFEIFRMGFITQRAQTTPTITSTILPTSSPTLSISPTQPPITQAKGIWLSKDEILKLPTTGSAWGAVLSAANSNWGSACLYDNDCMHDVNTLAGALVSVRLNDTALRDKTIAGIQSAMKSTLSRALELSRGLQTYIIAADIVGYRTPEFEKWIRDMLVAKIDGHSGATGVLETAIKSSNNWGGHARATLAAAAVYLNDQTLMTEVVNAQKDFIGIDGPKQMVYTSTSWHADPNNKAGVNRKGTLIQGKNVSGALTEDWRRAAEYKWPPAMTNYMWSGMQGFVVTAVILHRANTLPFTAGDNAVVRASDALYGTGEAAVNSPKFNYPAVGDDTWIPWVINYYGGTSYATVATSPGKNMGWTDWTHAK